MYSGKRALALSVCLSVSPLAFVRLMGSVYVDLGQVVNELMETLSGVVFGGESHLDD